MIDKLVIVLEFCLVLVKALDNHYCQLPCDYVVQNFTHTVCEREKEICGPGPICGPDFQVMSLTDADRQYILDIHNYLRNRVALGYEKRGKQPPASNMNMLTYNKELEYIAQCWANSCNGSPLNHDICRRTAEYEHVGQNLGFINSSIPQIDIVKSIKQLVLLWYDEVAIYKNEWIPVTEDRPEYKVGHYTQMIWANTLEIGCAATYYTSYAYDATWHHMVFVCNYGPGGNYLGDPVYNIGTPVSNCPKGVKPNGKYKGLCGKLKTVKETDKHIEHFKNNVFHSWYNLSKI